MPVPSSVIIVAAGSSSRMGGNVRKPYLKLRGKPILSWSIAALSGLPGLAEIVLVTRPDDRKRAAAAAKLARLPKAVKLAFADGGARRQDSVLSGIKAASPDSQLVLIHDAARPFPRMETMVQACAEAYQMGAAILAARVKDTVKREARAKLFHHNKDGGVTLIETTVPRADLWHAQTPQIFKRDLILNLFERLQREAPDHEVTDDASICEYFNQPVALIESSDVNFKVTRPEDLMIAEAVLKNSRNK